MLIGLTVTAAAALSALWVALVALSRASASRQRLASLARADVDVVDALLARISAIDSMRVEVSRLTELVTSSNEEVGRSLRHVAVVRYDAFRELTGRLSYSAALLDDTGDGVVFTTLHGRSDSRSIAKGVRAGQSEGLTPEEEQAVKYALAGEGP